MLAGDMSCPSSALRALEALVKTLVNDGASI